MTLRLRQIVCAVGLAVLAACQTVPEFDDRDWISQLDGVDIIILGETHDNAEHHRLQAAVIEAVQPDAVVFEMVPVDKTDAVADALASGTSLRAALDWDASGWPDWALYEPVFAAASVSRILGAGLPRDRVRRSMRDGAQAVSGLPETYGLSKPLPGDQIRELTQEFIDAHCGLIAPEMAAGMIEAQRLRDATFAARTLDAHAASPGPAPVVLIAGSGHARKDRGVPLYLSRVQPDARVRVVGFIEAGTAKDPGLYDVIRVTDAAQRDDPCEGFVRQSGA